MLSMKLRENNSVAESQNEVFQSLSIYFYRSFSCPNELPAKMLQFMVELGLESTTLAYGTALELIIPILQLLDGSL
jgi:hypothetical protein